jgi:hypothetical protein
MGAHNEEQKLLTTFLPMDILHSLWVKRACKCVKIDSNMVFLQLAQDNCAFNENLYIFILKNQIAGPKIDHATRK